jgi:hypothetical protein
MEDRIWVCYYVCRVEDEIPWIESPNMTEIDEAKRVLLLHREKSPKDKFVILKIEEKRTILDE